jgi:hypothetical protein|nr:MAG TPA: hypothetical protein [Caudoviricetes sp.]
MRTTDLREIMRLAWQLVKKNGFAMAEALKTAWLNFKLKTKMRGGIVKFYYQKVSGEIREAYGTLRADLLPETKGTDRKPNPTVQVYFDTEREEYRCFKVANLVKIA